MNLPFQIVGVDHIGFIVGSAKHAAHYFQTLFGFEYVAYSGLETGDREVVSYVVQQNNIRFVFNSPLVPGSQLNEHLQLHGDGVRDVALRVNDAKSAWEHATGQGAISLSEPTTMSDDNGTVVLSAIQAFGDTVHTFVERKDYRGLFLPGYVKAKPSLRNQPVGLHSIDHIVGSHPEGDTEKIAAWYQKVFNFHRYWTVDDKDISTEYSALRSVVVADQDERIKIPLYEPAPVGRKSQVQEFLDFYGGAGIQHIAMTSTDIVATVRKLIDNGVEFLPIPRRYYDTLPERVGRIEEKIDDLARLKILVDRDDDGYLLQLLTKPVEVRPTLFLEVIQRRGSRSFGRGNYKAIFESIAREQEQRGNL